MKYLEIFWCVDLTENCFQKYKLNSIYRKTLETELICSTIKMILNITKYITYCKSLFLICFYNLLLSLFYFIEVLFLVCNIGLSIHLRKVSILKLYCPLCDFKTWSLVFQRMEEYATKTNIFYQTFIENSFHCQGI